MRTELHLSLRRTRVREGELRQHDLRLFENESTLVACSALGSPRLWTYVLDAALDGFAEGFARPHDGRPSTRLHQGLDGAQKRLRKRIDALIERRMPDVSLLAVTLEKPRIHVLCVGPARVYVRSGDATRRLTPRDDRAEGLLRAAPAWCTEELHQGDFVVGGSLNAFRDESLQRLAQRLAMRPAPLLPELADVLTSPLVDMGQGSALFAMRV